MNILREKHALRKQKRRWYVPGEHESTIPFDFVANQTLEECMSRLGSLEDLRNLDPWSPITAVHIQHVDHRTYAFTIHEQQPASNYAVT